MGSHARSRMTRWKHVSAVLRVFFLCAVAAPCTQALYAQAVVGTPWTGAPGITETVADIMERGRRAPAIPAEESFESKPRHTLRGFVLQDNPVAPAVAQWPSLD